MENNTNEVSSLMSELEELLTTKKDLPELKNMGAYIDISFENSLNFEISDNVKQLENIIEKAYNNGTPTQEWQSVQEQICNNGQTLAQDKLIPTIIMMKAKLHDFNGMQPLFKSALSLNKDSNSVWMVKKVCDSYPENVNTIEKLCNETNDIGILCNIVELDVLPLDDVAKRIAETPIKSQEDISALHEFGESYAMRINSDIRKALKLKYDELNMSNVSQQSMEDGM